MLAVATSLCASLSLAPSAPADAPFWMLKGRAFGWGALSEAEREGALDLLLGSGSREDDFQRLVLEEVIGALGS